MPDRRDELRDGSRPAPVVVFVYNRPWHTRQTLAALQNNELASATDVYVYSDGPRSTNDCEAVTAVREYLASVDGFASFTVVEHEGNTGLAANIAGGVSEVIERYGRVIVLEDDMVTAPTFLSYMNRALDRFADEPAVWHVSAWTSPLDTRNLPETWLWRLMNCSGGWGTWADRWARFEKNPDRLVREWDRAGIRRFNLGGDLWGQVIANQEGRINTWAIFWYATIFEHGGLCLNPRKSYVQNIGHDGSGEHSDVTDRYSVDLADTADVALPDEIREHPGAVRAVRQFHRSLKPPLHRRVGSRLRRVLGS